MFTAMDLAGAGDVLIKGTDVPAEHGNGFLLLPGYGGKRGLPSKGPGFTIAAQCGSKMMFSNSVERILDNRLQLDLDVAANDHIAAELWRVVQRFGQTSIFPPSRLPPSPCARFSARSFLSQELLKCLPQDLVRKYGNRSLMFDVAIIMCVRVSSG